MVLTKRDLELFRKLSSFGMLSTQQIGFIVFGGIALTTVLRRLRLLEDHFYLKRLDGLITHELLWVLTPKGAEGGNVSIPKRHWSKNMLEHDYKLLSLRILLEGNGIAHSWTPEHEIRSMVFKKYGLRTAKEKLIPDGLMGIEVNGKKESVAIELELTLKNQRRLKETLRRYQSKYETFAVWYIVSSKMIMDQVHKLWRKCGAYYAPIKIFYSYYDDVMKNPMAVKLFSSESPKVLGDYWRALPAQETAHHLSSHDDKKIELKTEVTEENHAPILDIAS